MGGVASDAFVGKGHDSSDIPLPGINVNYIKNGSTTLINATQNGVTLGKNQSGEGSQAANNGEITASDHPGVTYQTPYLNQFLNNFSWWQPQRLAMGSQLNNDSTIKISGADKYQPEVQTINGNTSQTLNNLTAKDGVKDLIQSDGTKFSLPSGVTVSWYNSSTDKTTWDDQMKDTNGNVMAEPTNPIEKLKTTNTSAWAKVTYSDNSVEFVNIPLHITDSNASKYTPSYLDAKGLNDKDQNIVPSIKDTDNKEQTIADIISTDTNKPGFVISDTNSKFTIDPKTGVITIPKGSTQGEYTVPVTVTYKDGSQDTTTAKVTVDDAPKVSGLHTDNPSQVPAPSTAITNFNNGKSSAQAGYPSNVEWMNSTPTIDPNFKGTKDFPATVTYPDGTTTEVSIPVSVTGSKQDGDHTVYYGDQSSVEFSGTPVDTHKTTDGSVDLSAAGHPFNKIVVNKGWNSTTHKYVTTITYNLSSDGKTFVNAADPSDTFNADKISYSLQNGFKPNTNEENFKNAQGNVIKGDTLASDDAEKTQSGESLSGNSRYRYDFSINDSSVATKLGLPSGYNSWVNVYYNFYSATPKEGTVEVTHNKADTLPDAATVVNTDKLTKDHNSEIATTDGKPNIQWVDGSVDFNKIGNQNGKVRITFTDGTHLDVEVPVNVKNNDADDNEPTTTIITTPQGVTPDAPSAVTNESSDNVPTGTTKLPEGTKVTWTDPDQVTKDVQTPGNHDENVTVTYPDGTKDTKTTTVVVNQDPKVTPIVITDGKLPQPSTGISNYDNGGTKPVSGYPSEVEWANGTPAVTPGVSNVDVKVTYPSPDPNVPGETKTVSVPLVVAGENQTVVKGDNGYVIITTDPTAVKAHETSDKTQVIDAKDAIKSINSYKIGDDGKIATTPTEIDKANITASWTTPIDTTVTKATATGKTISDESVKVDFGTADDDVLGKAAKTATTNSFDITAAGAEAKDNSANPVAITLGSDLTSDQFTDLVNNKIPTNEIASTSWQTKPTKTGNGVIRITFNDKNDGTPTYLDVTITAKNMKVTGEDDTYDPKGKETSIKQGNQVPEAKNSVDPSTITNVPTGTTYTWAKQPDPSQPGKQNVEVTVHYPDGTTQDTTIPVVVTEQPKVQPITVNKGETPDVTKTVTNVDPSNPGKPSKVVWTDGKAPDTTTSGVTNTKVTVTYPDLNDPTKPGETVTKTVPVIVVDPNTQTVVQNDQGAVIVTTNDVTIHKTSDNNAATDNNAKAAIKSVETYTYDKDGNLVKNADSSTTGVTAKWDDLDTESTDTTSVAKAAHHLTVTFDANSDAVKNGISKSGDTTKAPVQVTISGATKSENKVDVKDPAAIHALTSDQLGTLVNHADLDNLPEGQKVIGYSWATEPTVSNGKVGDNGVVKISFNDGTSLNIKVDGSQFNYAGQASEFTPHYAETTVMQSETRTASNDGWTDENKPAGNVTYALADNHPDWISIDSSTGIITYKPIFKQTDAKGYTVPVTITYADGSKDTVNAKVTVTDKTTTLTPGENSVTKDNHGDLYHDVTRTVNIDGKNQPTVQTVHFGRTGVYDETTGKFVDGQFGEWQVLDNEGKLSDQTSGKWDAVNVDLKDGYTPTATDDKGNAVELINNQVPANSEVTGLTNNVKINVTYTANDSHQTFHYVDEDGNQAKNPDGTSVPDQQVSGKTDEQKHSSDVPVPAGWELVDSPSDFKIPAPDKDTAINVKIKHGHTEVTPDKPKAPGDKTPTGKEIQGAHESDLNKTITRTIEVQDPHKTTPDKTTQTLEFERTATVDDVDGSVTYGDWTPKNGSKNSFDKFTVPTVEGYTPSQASVAAETPTNDEISNWGKTNHDVTITYTAGRHTMTYTFVDDDNNSATVGTPVQISGNTDDTKDVSLTVPEGYVLAEGQTLPTSYKFTSADNQAATIHLKHEKTTADEDHIPENYKKSDFTKEIKRTITVTEPGKAPEDHSQTITIKRTGTYDHVTKKVTFGDWSKGSFDEYDAPTIDGYTPSQEKVDAQNDVTDGYVDTPVNITYTKDKTQADNNNPVGTDITVDKGSTPDPKAGIKNSADLDKLPDPNNKDKHTTYTWKDDQTPDTTKPGDTTGTVVVTYPDGSKDKVTVTIHVVDTTPSVPSTPSEKPAEDGEITIIYKDKNGKEVGKKTIPVTKGKSIDPTNDIKNNVPTGWKVASNATIPSSVSDGETVDVLVDPIDSTNDNNPASTDTTKKPSGEGGKDTVIKHSSVKGVTKRTNVSVANNNGVKANANVKSLPETGDRENKLGIVGLTLVGIAALISLAGDRRRKHR